MLKKSTAVYAIGIDGLKRSTMFVPRVEKKVDTTPPRDWNAEQRADDIERHAAQISARQGLAFVTIGELNVVWPDDRWVDLVTVDDADEDQLLVAVQIRIPAASLDAHRAEAERMVDEEEAREKQEAADREAQRLANTAALAKTAQAHAEDDASAEVQDEEEAEA